MSEHTKKGECRLRGFGTKIHPSRMRTLSSHGRSLNYRVVLHTGEMGIVSPAAKHTAGTDLSLSFDRRDLDRPGPSNWRGRKKSWLGLHGDHDG